MSNVLVDLQTWLKEQDLLQTSKSMLESIIVGSHEFRLYFLNLVGVFTYRSCLWLARYSRTRGLIGQRSVP
jgi:hypothetical protein